MGLKVWLAGKLVDKDDAKISVYDHALLYGDGVFEGIRAYAGRVFKLDEHLRRLYDSARAIRLAIPMTREQIAAAIHEAMKANNLSDCYIRLVVTRGAGYLGLSPTKTSNPVVFVIADQIELYPPETYEKGLAVITASTIRTPPNALSARIKSLNYLNNILAKIEALDAGVPEALMLNHEGYVAEASAENVFTVRDGAVSTPPPEASILLGITRGVVLELCRKFGIPAQERNLTKHDVYTADECFLTGTGAEIIAVTSVDKRVIGVGKAGPVTKRLLEGFRKLTRE
jgi:branched-chain amino acid aminotransferase